MAVLVVAGVGGLHRDPILFHCAVCVFPESGASRAFTSSAFKLAAIAALWLAIAAASDEVTHLYTREEFWIDFRFYVGWVLGLLLAPYPYHASK